jgi:hypothetical protein
MRRGSCAPAWVQEEQPWQLLAQAQAQGQVQPSWQQQVRVLALAQGTAQQIDIATHALTPSGNKHQHAGEMRSLQSICSSSLSYLGRREETKGWDGHRER